MTAPTAKIEEGKHQTDECNQNNWAISIQDKLDKLPQPNKKVRLNYSIFWAPRNLREMDSEAYRPKIISIGPLHRRCHRLQPMQAHKLRFLRSCLDRTGRDLELFINTMSPLVDQARRCYADPTNMIRDQEFMEMLLLDSCFILELLIAVAEGFRGDDDPLFSIRSAVLQIRSDMLLFENQIPLFILNELFPIIAGSDFPGYLVSQLAFRFFRHTVAGSIKILQETPNTGNKDEEGLHLLNVIRQNLITLQSTRPTSSSSSSSSSRPLDKLPNSYHRPNLIMPYVSLLRDSGVKFKKRTRSKLTDIKFERDILKIPPLIVHDTTKSIFLNLIAFEQCHWECSDQIISYIAFMNGLINTPHDVAYLQQKGIIVHRQGSKEDVAQLFNDLTQVIGIDYMDGCHNYVHLYYVLNKYVCRNWPACSARWELDSFKREYFPYRWSIIAVVAAVLVIGLTLTQTLYSILSYHIGHS